MSLSTASFVHKNVSFELINFAACKNNGRKFERKLN